MACSVGPLWQPASASSTAPPRSGRRRLRRWSRRSEVTRRRSFTNVGSAGRMPTTQPSKRGRNDDDASQTGERGRISRPVMRQCHGGGRFVKRFQVLPALPASLTPASAGSPGRSCASVWAMARAARIGRARRAGGVVALVGTERGSDAFRSKKAGTETRRRPPGSARARGEGPPHPRPARSRRRRGGGPSGRSPQSAGARCAPNAGARRTARSDRAPAGDEDGGVPAVERARDGVDPPFRPVAAEPLLDRLQQPVEIGEKGGDGAPGASLVRCGKIRNETRIPDAVPITVSSSRRIRSSGEKLPRRP